MRPALLLCVWVLLASSVGANDDLYGRYSGVATGKQPDGTGPEVNLFLILNQDGNRFTALRALSPLSTARSRVKIHSSTAAK